MDYDQIISKQLDKCFDIMVVKAKEYASDEDRLHNFHVAKELFGCDTKKALSGMMSKHTVSIYDMCNSGKTYPTALWEEKITDNINYLLLLRCVVAEENSDGKEA